MSKTTTTTNNQRPKQHKQPKQPQQPQQPKQPKQPTTTTNTTNTKTTHNTQPTHNQHTATSFHSSVSFFACDLFSEDFMWAAEGAVYAGSKEPAMARGKGGGERRDEQRHGPENSSPRAASTVYFSMDDDGDMLAARPTPLVEVRPQSGVQRHTAVHIVDILPYVQILLVPVPQVGDQLVEFMQRLDTVLSLDRIPQRCVDRHRPQSVEQLVEVPTGPGYALSVLASKVFSRRELRGILSGQGSTASGAELIVDIPVPPGDLQGSHPGQRSRTLTSSSSSSSSWSRRSSRFTP